MGDFQQIRVSIQWEGKMQVRTIQIIKQSALDAFIGYLTKNPERRISLDYHSSTSIDTQYIPREMASAQFHGTKLSKILQQEGSISSLRNAVAAHFAES